MSNDEKNNRVIGVLRELYNNKNWDASLPLKVLKKRIGAYISQLEHEAEHSDAPKKSNAATETLPDGYVKIYVMLHQNDGENLKSWNASLLSLTSSVLGRAVYAAELEAEQALKSKADKSKEGYAELWVPEDIIIKLPLDKSVFDKNGYKILSVKQKAIKKQNIKYFYHALGNKYKFSDSSIMPMAKK